LQQLQQRLVELVDELADGTVAPPVATAMIGAVRALVDLQKFSLEVGEQREVEARLAQLEQTLAGNLTRRRGWP
jgi:hypothetical protein